MRCQAGGVPFPIPTGRDPTVLQLRGDVRDVPVEIQEAMYPYRIESKPLHSNSGGPGKFRGGLGIEKIYRFLQPLSLHEQDG